MSAYRAVLAEEGAEHDARLPSSIRELGRSWDEVLGGG
jgi:hypothetical protein